ncbi:Mor transcription activator family protein [Desulfobacula sp.]|uniref:Mor transcription activator family protein n=1 Tax=Desulfobacula sp. TaxID=2593537 RepID=UPI0025B89B9F|nr:Mor transcription activator family protein [Desulfobacula sp.]MBC2703987.1 hypothetical protein [Desulfobacula sp.]
MAQNKKHMINDSLNPFTKIENFNELIQTVVDVIGIDSTVKLIKEFGGEALYLPKLESVMRNSRNRDIRKDFTGNNHRELSKKYRLTVRQIRYILRKKKGVGITKFR